MSGSGNRDFAPLLERICASVRDLGSWQATLKPRTLVITFSLLSLSAFFTFAQGGQPSSGESIPRKWLILPGGATGSAVSTQSSEADLVRIYGDKNVVSHDVGIGEGETEPGTELFPADPLRRLDILWKDPVEKRGPKNVRISGTKSVWGTAHGISLGTTLKRLEQLNKRPFRLAGFGFDYSGTVLSWSGGALENELGQEANRAGRVILRLNCSPHQSQQPEYRSLQGDRVFSSGHPALQKLNPTVYEVIWLFP
ncbi:MAG: hypothetical protein ABSG16_24715 [Candidatus Acidiferrum sp.]